MVRISTSCPLALCPLIFAGILIGASGCGSEAPAPQTSPVARSAESAPPVTARRTDPRPTTKEGCDLCNGLWGAHGIDSVEVCICRTDDAGKGCVDGRECEGQCVVREGDAFQVTSDGNPPLGFFTGHCSAYDTTFGCNLIIPIDIDTQLPLDADTAAEHLCVD